MKGADDFCKVFKQAEQNGRLYILPGSHARGNTFELYVLPADEKVIVSHNRNPPLNKNTVEVYGVIAGQRGWTESYGWLHQGRWVEDFNKLYESRGRAIKLKNAESIARMKEKESKKENDVKLLLSDY